MTYTTTLNNLSALLQRQDSELQRLRAENRRLKIDLGLVRARLNAPDALDAELWKARAEAWERRARLAEAANKEKYR